jgi:hypothetical protein
MHNARDALAAFNGHYHKAALMADRPRRGKREQQQLRRQVQRDWAQIMIDHPNDHVQLKSDLRDAIRRTTAASRLIDQARGTIAIESARNRASFYRDFAEMFENLILAEMRLLDGMKVLAELEERIGPAVGFIQAHADRDIARLKGSITNTGKHVGFLRQAEDGYRDEDRKNARRFGHQKNWRTSHPTRGRLWYGNIANNPLACVGVCLAGDQHNRIVDRVVLKDVWFIDTPELWTSLGEWIGDPQDPLVKIPTEGHVMGRLAATRQKNIVRMRGCHLAPEKLMYRIRPLVSLQNNPILTVQRSVLNTASTATGRTWCTTTGC